jgi:hypothetical protein
VDFRTTDTFRADVDAVLGAYADADLVPDLGPLRPLSAGEVVEHARHDDVVHVEVRYRYRGDLPPGAAKLVDPDRLTWVLVSDLDLKLRQSSLVLEPDHYADRLRARAVETFEPAPDGGTVRTTEGRLAVQVLLVAKAVERALVSGLVEWLANEAAAIDGWIARPPTDGT